jgi:hypothetical protein
MLKKVMIICLALSFVFIGGIGIALAADQYQDREGVPDWAPILHGPNGPNGPNGSCDFISNDSSIILATDDCLGPIRSGQSNGRGPAPSSGDGDPDGPGWPTDFIDNDSSMILAYGENGKEHAYDQEDGEPIRDRICQD